LDALNAARRLDREGQDAEVLTQSADFGLRMEWTNRLGRLRARVGEGSERQTSSLPLGLGWSKMSATFEPCCREQCLFLTLARTLAPRRRVPV
jgi:hypothetical protein